MKLPFDFGIKLLFRLVMPGFFLSLGLLPVLNLILDLLGGTSQFEYGFLIMLIATGWLLTLSDMGIYMLLEGRRFWPEFLRRFFWKREEGRLKRIRARTTSSDQQIQAEAFFDIRNFPMDANYEYSALWPSRLGNLLAAFEGYSLRVYGIDSIFYWPRIWLKLDKDTREEIDSNQALADSAAYTSVALYLGGLLWLLYAGVGILLVAATRSAPLMTRFTSGIDTMNRHWPRVTTACLLSAVSMLGGYLVYRSSIRLHAQFGEIFKSVFDAQHLNLSVSDIIEEISMLTAKSPSVCLNKNIVRQDQFRIAARYLQYYRYRCANPGCAALLKPNEIEQHVCAPANPPEREKTVSANAAVNR